MNSSKYEIIISVDATHDLNQIRWYLDRYHPNLFKTFYQKMKNKISLLEFQPYMTGIFLFSNGNEYRKIIVNNYVVVYVIFEEIKTVVIYRIFHGSENYIEKI